MAKRPITELRKLIRKIVREELENQKKSHPWEEFSEPETHFEHEPEFGPTGEPHLFHEPDPFMMEHKMDSPPNHPHKIKKR